MSTAEHWKKKLNLEPHPEGGWFRESYRSAGIIEASGLPNYIGSRHFSTSIYYLLDGNEFSAFHRLKSDEVWHFYDGCSLILYVMAHDGKLLTKVLGRNIDAGENLQVVIPAGHWFAAIPSDKNSFTLAGCGMSPGFDTKDFELASAADLAAQFPLHADVIRLLTKA